MLLATLAAAAPAAAQDRAEARGFKPETAFEVGEVDRVNLFNGNLVLEVPLAAEVPVGGGFGYRLGLVYNSGVWELRDRPLDYDPPCGPRGRCPADAWRKAVPNPFSNAGLGWTLSFGRLFPPTPPDGDDDPPGGEGEHTLTVSKAGSGDGGVGSQPPGIDCPSGCVSDRAEFPADVTVLLTADPDPGFALDHWWGDCVDLGDGRAEVVMSGDRSCQAVFEPPPPPETFVLSLAYVGHDGGRVELDTGESCSGEDPVPCLFTVDAGTIVGMTAEEGGDAVFQGWGGSDCAEDELEVEVTMDRDRYCTVSFFQGGPGPFTLSVGTTGGGSARVYSVWDPGIDCGVDCDESYGKNTVVALAVDVLDAGAEHCGWFDSSPDCDDCYVTMDSAKGCTARIRRDGCEADDPPACHLGSDLFGLTVSKLGAGGGRVTSEPAGIDCGATCSAELPEGVAELSATPDPGSLFAGWGGDCDTAGRVQLNRSRSCTATFEVDYETLRVSLVGSAGEVDVEPPGEVCHHLDDPCDYELVHGERVTLTARPLAGSVFDEWRGEGCDGSEPEITLDMDAGRYCTAFFHAENVLTVTRSGGGSGTVTSDPTGIDCGSDCSAPFEADTEVTLTADPDGASDFAGWGGDCDAGGGVLMDGPRECDARFELVERDLHLTVTRTGEDGWIEIDPGDIPCEQSCDESFPHDTEVVLTAHEEGDAAFDGWSGNCAADPADPLVSRFRIREDRFCSAHFRQDGGGPYTLDVNKRGTGTVETADGNIYCGDGAPGPCSYDYDEGTIVELILTGEHDGRWTDSSSDDCFDQILTMDADKLCVPIFALRAESLESTSDSTSSR